MVGGTSSNPTKSMAIHSVKILAEAGEVGMVGFMLKGWWVQRRGGGILAYRLCLFPRVWQMPWSLISHTFRQEALHYTERE